jgi:hypothetical protein
MEGNPPPPKKKTQQHHWKQKQEGRPLSGCVVVEVDKEGGNKNEKTHIGLDVFSNIGMLLCESLFFPFLSL